MRPLPLRHPHQRALVLHTPATHTPDRFRRPLRPLGVPLPPTPLHSVRRLPLPIPLATEGSPPMKILTETNHTISEWKYPNTFTLHFEHPRYGHLTIKSPEGILAAVFNMNYVVAIINEGQNADKLLENSA